MILARPLANTTLDIPPKPALPHHQKAYKTLCFQWFLEMCISNEHKHGEAWKHEKPCKSLYFQWFWHARLPTQRSTCHPNGHFHIIKKLIKTCVFNDFWKCVSRTNISTPRHENMTNLLEAYVFNDLGTRLPAQRSICHPNGHFHIINKLIKPYVFNDF